MGYSYGVNKPAGYSKEKKHRFARLMGRGLLGLVKSLVITTVVAAAVIVGLSLLGFQGGVYGGFQDTVWGRAAVDRTGVSTGYSASNPIRSETAAESATDCATTNKTDSTGSETTDANDTGSEDTDDRPSVKLAH